MSRGAAIFKFLHRVKALLDQITVTEPPYRDHAQLMEAYRYDPDNAEYWWGGYPKKWWANERFCAEVRDAEARESAAWNAVFAAENATRTAGQKWDWNQYRGMTPAEILAQRKSV